MLLQEKTEEILSRFPGPVWLRPSLRKWSVMLVASAAVVALSLSGIVLRIEPTWLCWFLVALFGAFMVAAVVVPTLLGLRLDSDGFTIVGIGGRSRLVRWQDANHFQAVEPYPCITQVAFDIADAKKGWSPSVLQGHTHSLGEDFGMTADDLATLMNRWRERAISPQF